MPAERVIPLPMDEPHVIDGVTVTLMDANHCPGACMMLFKVPVKGSRPQMILHTGDMRWQPRLADHPALKACKVDILYMDTTYCSPKHIFPSQDNAIATLVRVMREAYAEERKTLFVVGSYHIGKERAFLGAAKALDFRIWCHQAKKKVMEWCEIPAADMRRIVTKESAAQIHVVFMGQGLQPEALEQRRLKGDYAKVVAFRPTGWSFQKNGLQTRREGNVTIYGIPYSEHSSFAELRDCVKRLKPKRLIPTVNCPDAASARAIVDRFADLMDLSRDKSRLDCYFGRTASAPACSPSSATAVTNVAALAYSTQRSAASARTKLFRHAIEAEPDVDLYVNQSEQLRPATQSCHASAHGQLAVKAEPTQVGSEVHDHAKEEERGLLAAPGWADDEDEVASDGSGDSPLPVRRRGVPSHAYSAPADLGPSTQDQLDSAVKAKRLSQPVPPASCQAEQQPKTHQHQPESTQPGISDTHGDAQPQSRCCTVDFAGQTDVTSLLDPGGGAEGQTRSILSGNLDQHSRFCVQQAVLCHESEADVDAPCQANPDHPASCDAQAQHDVQLPIAQAVQVVDVPAIMLDSIDVAEQIRIFSHIQQETLHARHCLPTKKRQLTLGSFVVPKRVK